VEEEQHASTSGSSPGGEEQQQRTMNGSGDFLSSLLNSTYTVQRPGEGVEWSNNRLAVPGGHSAYNCRSRLV
jgi:hypothetical protein